MANAAIWYSGISLSKIESTTYLISSSVSSPPLRFFSMRAAKAGLMNFRADMIFLRILAKLLWLYQIFWHCHKPPVHRRNTGKMSRLLLRMHSFEAQNIRLESTSATKWAALTGKNALEQALIPRVCMRIGSPICDSVKCDGLDVALGKIPRIPRAPESWQVDSGIQRN